MSVEIKTLKRVFKYGSVNLPDPGAQFTPEEVRELYCATYAELTNAVIEGPQTTDRSLMYEFVIAVGTKGASDGTPARFLS